MKMSNCCEHYYSLSAVDNFFSIVLKGDIYYSSPTQPQICLQIFSLSPFLRCWARNTHFTLHLWYSINKQLISYASLLASRTELTNTKGLYAAQLFRSTQLQVQPCTSVASQIEMNKCDFTLPFSGRDVSNYIFKIDFHRTNKDRLFPHKNLKWHIIRKIKEQSSFIGTSKEN